jgi:hypothetical protein
MQDLPAVVMVIPPPSTASSSDPDIEPAHVVVHNADASHAFSPSALAPEDIQTFVRCAINGKIHRKYKINEPPTDAYMQMACTIFSTLALVAVAPSKAFVPECAPRWCEQRRTSQAP